MKIEKGFNLFFFAFWIYCTYHFGMGQLLDYPRWEHYVVEGYFLFSATVVTWIGFKMIPSSAPSANEVETK